MTEYVLYKLKILHDKIDAGCNERKRGKELLACMTLGGIISNGIVLYIKLILDEVKEGACGIHGNCILHAYGFNTSGNVNAYNLTLGIEERAAGISGVGSRVGHDEIALTDLTVIITDDTAGHAYSLTL